MATRQLSSWLDGYQEYTERWEPPKQFNQWVAFTILSIATGRKVWLSEGSSKLFPNLYTVLVAESGVGKTSAMREAVPFLDLLNVRRSPSKFLHPSQMVVDMLEASVTHPELGIITPYMLWFEELPSSLGREAYKSGVLADLTTLYDCPEFFVNPTLKRQYDKVPSPFLCMLAGTTPEGLFDVLPAGAMGQGFTSRLILIWGEYPATAERVSDKPWDWVHDQLKDKLMFDLEFVSKLSGAVTLSDMSKVLWRDYYANRPTPEQEFTDSRLQGYASRKPMYIKKLAMLLSIAESDSMVIEAYHLEKAIQFIAQLDAHVGKIYNEVAPSVVVQHYQKVRNVLEKAPGKALSHAKLMQRFSHSLDAVTFKLVMQSLEEMGRVSRDVVKHGSTSRFTIYYKLVD